MCLSSPLAATGCTVSCLRRSRSNKYHWCAAGSLTVRWRAGRSGCACAMAGRNPVARPRRSSPSWPRSGRYTARRRRATSRWRPCRSTAPSRTPACAPTHFCRRRAPARAGRGAPAGSLAPLCTRWRERVRARQSARPWHRPRASGHFAAQAWVQTYSDGCPGPRRTGVCRPRLPLWFLWRGAVPETAHARAAGVPAVEGGAGEPGSAGRAVAGAGGGLWPRAHHGRAYAHCVVRTPPRVREFPGSHPVLCFQRWAAARLEVCARHTGYGLPTPQLISVRGKASTSPACSSRGSLRRKEARSGFA